MIESMGWLSALFLGGCGIPQAYLSWRTGRADDVSMTFLLMWLAGEIFGIIYILNIDKFLMPIFANEVLNVFLIAIILKYKLRPRLTLK
jgi:uncharacterized protein with PQ loop repeat